MSTPVLSICIPTFNRAKVIKECVNKLLQYNNDDIEIVVSDDCSNDNTLEVLTSIRDDRLKVYENEMNLGASYNSHMCFMRASGKYSILISDEDDLNLEAVRRLISELNVSDMYSVYIVSGSRGPNDKLIYPDKEYNSGWEALRDLGFNIRYMTGVIFKTDLYKLKIGNISFDDAPNIFSVYSFMYAMTVLFFEGTTKTSSIEYYSQNRFQQTTITNNSKDTPDVFYFEPTDRIRQLKIWIRVLAKLPITKRQRVYIVYKIIYDASVLCIRAYDVNYQIKYKSMLPAYYEMFLSHMKGHNIEQDLDNIKKAGIDEMLNTNLVSKIEFDKLSLDDSEIVEYVLRRENELKERLANTKIMKMEFY